jgi:hypothetical protein
MEPPPGEDEPPVFDQTWVDAAPLSEQDLRRHRHPTPSTPVPWRTWQPAPPHPATRHPAAPPTPAPPTPAPPWPAPPRPASPPLEHGRRTGLGPLGILLLVVIAVGVSVLVTLRATGHGDAARTRPPATATAGAGTGTGSGSGAGAGLPPAPVPGTSAQPPAGRRPWAPATWVPTGDDTMQSAVFARLAVGSCLTSTVGLTVYLVPCTGPHSDEVTSTYDLTERFPTTPTMDQVQSLHDELCPAAGRAWTGGDDPRYTTGYLWHFDNGVPRQVVRRFVCTVELRGQTPFTGTLRGAAG